MNILVLGSNGQLGRCFKDQFLNLNYEVIFTNRDEIDVADLDLTKKKIKEIAPDIVINASAYTSVDEAEKHHKLADEINHLAVSNIAVTCSELNCWLFHISTDYVFDEILSFHIVKTVKSVLRILMVGQRQMANCYPENPS